MVPWQRPCPVHKHLSWGRQPRQCPGLRSIKAARAPLNFFIFFFLFLNFSIQKFTLLPLPHSSPALLLNLLPPRPCLREDREP